MSTKRVFIICSLSSEIRWYLLLCYVMSETCSNMHFNYKHHPMVFFIRYRGTKYRISLTFFDISIWNLQTGWSSWVLSHIFFFKPICFFFCFLNRFSKLICQIVFTFFLVIFKIQESSSVGNRVLRHCMQGHWLRLKNWIQESVSRRPLLCIKIDRAWRHSDVISWKPMV